LNAKQAKRCDCSRREDKLQVKITLDQKCHFMTNPIQLQVDKQLKMA
jgi:capsule polysaccharide modification protein KpsS